MKSFNAEARDIMSAIQRHGERCSHENLRLQVYCPVLACEYVADTKLIDNLELVEVALRDLNDDVQEHYNQTHRLD